MQLTNVVDANRKSLKSVESFIDNSDYHKSPDNYGLPQSVYHLIDQPIGDQITYVDLIMFLQTFFTTKRVKYVEIGVSVLKTFYQVSNFLKESDLYAFDINKINPTIEKRYVSRSKSNQINCYEYNSNNISYFQGDVFNKQDFDKFKEHINSKANIIFSDAHHSGGGLESEYNWYIRDALADEFILYYDDLENPEMRDVFIKIFKDIKTKNHNVSAALLKVNGWLGQHEYAHSNGIITSLDLKTIMRDNKVDIPLTFLEMRKE